MRPARAVTVVAVVAAGTLAMVAAPGAQAPAGPQFEVASIKLTRSTGDSAVVGGGANGSYFRHAGSIRVLIGRAYQVPFVQQLGGPDWTAEDDYTIAAKIPDGVPQTPENLRSMIRELLADRFKLVVREEERTVQIYALDYARADKKLGPKVQPSKCPAREAGQPLTVPPNQAGMKWDVGPTCGQVQSGRRSGRGVVMFGGNPFGSLADSLQYVLGRPVVNRTGITGSYDLELIYAPQELSGSAASDSDLPSLFAAIQEQLGLKLESTTAPMKVVVIDSIARPTED